MPMAINSREEYEKVINVSWFMQSQAIDDVTYVKGKIISSLLVY